MSTKLAVLGGVIATQPKQQPTQPESQDLRGSPFSYPQQGQDIYDASQQQAQTGQTGQQAGWGAYPIPVRVA